MDTWHCIYYKHLNAGMSWHSQVATKVAEAVEGKKTIVYMDFVKDVAPVAIALQKASKVQHFMGRSSRLVTKASLSVIGEVV